MKRTARLALGAGLLALALSGCATNTEALLYCVANQHNANRRCT